jgi:sulfate permease family protein
VEVPARPERRPFCRHVRNGDQHAAKYDRNRIRDQREADLQRELTTIGVANLAAAALGSYVSTVALNRTSLNYVAGGRGRLSGLTVAAVSVLMLTVNPGFLAYVPKFVLGALLLYLGAQLVYEWLIDSARRISLLEYASLLAITLLILQAGFIAGVLIGVVIGCATFAVSASRVNAIKFRFDGSEYRSTFDRGPEELAILAAHGRDWPQPVSGSMSTRMRSSPRKAKRPAPCISSSKVASASSSRWTMRARSASAASARTPRSARWASERIKRENGALAQALLTYVIQVMAERLSFARKVIGVWRR